MTVYCKKLQVIIAEMQSRPERVQALEDDLQYLVSWNHPDDNVLDAAAMLSIMAKALRENTEHLAYVLDIVRCCLVALWPYMEEVSQSDLKALWAWYDTTLPMETPPEPDSTKVPRNLCLQWVHAQQLRTLDGVRELARLKGLWLLKNDIPYARRYQVIVPGAKNDTLLSYSEASAVVETYAYH